MIFYANRSYVDLAHACGKFSLLDPALAERAEPSLIRHIREIPMLMLRDAD